MPTLITTSLEHAMDLAVTAQGRTITVGPGPLKVETRDTSFPGDSVEIEERAHPTSVIGLLCKDTQDGGRIVLLVDEYVQDGVDLPWEFVRGGRYEPWAQLFQIEVPAGAGALEALPLYVWRMITPAQKAAEEG